MPVRYPYLPQGRPAGAPAKEPPREVFSRNRLQGRMLVFHLARCSGCGECIEVCPQKFLVPRGDTKKAVGWKVRVIPEPRPVPQACTDCMSCLPRRLGGDQEEGKPPVLCPWGVCTMCDLCTRACPDSAIFTLPMFPRGGAGSQETPVAEEAT